MPTKTKSILLKHGLMPDYRSIQLSEELLENYLIRQQQQHQNHSGDHSPHAQAAVGWLDLNDKETREQITILHSYFSNFCIPSPSFESVLNVYSLEQRRISSLNDDDNVTSLKNCPIATTATTTTQNNEQTNNNLPKETVIQTSSSSSHFIIKLLKSNKCVLLKLPLLFQLSFFRILNSAI